MTRTMQYITGDDETEQTWVVTYEYTPYRAATRLDPAEGGEFEFLSATCGAETMDANDWIAEYAVDLDKLEQEAGEAVSEEDERENGPRDPAWMSERGVNP